MICHLHLPLDIMIIPRVNGNGTRNIGEHSMVMNYIGGIQNKQLFLFKAASRHFCSVPTCTESLIYDVGLGCSVVYIAREKGQQL